LGLPVQFALLSTGESAAEKSSSSSTTTASGDPGAGGFISVRNFGKLEIPAGSLFSFTLPKDTFKHADPKISVVLEARAENGPLPDWLSFDRGTGKFTGRPPESLASFTVIVTARDSSGNEASTRVVLNFTGKGETAR
jgi:hypothetical protein